MPRKTENRINKATEWHEILSYVYPRVIVVCRVDDAFPRINTPFARLAMLGRKLHHGTRTSPARLSFVLKVPLCYLRPSIAANSVPRDRIHLEA